MNHEIFSEGEPVFAPRPKEHNQCLERFVSMVMIIVLVHYKGFFLLQVLLL